VTEAKNRLSALLDRVRHGETVLIEDRGVAVAQLAPVPRSDRRVDADRIVRLERAGVLQPARSSKAAPGLLSPPPRPKRSQPLSRLVIDDRKSGW
jgi:prevent-host-death family protein